MKSGEFLNMCTKCTFSIIGTNPILHNSSNFGSQGSQKSPKIVSSPMSSSSTCKRSKRLNYNSILEICFDRVDSTSIWTGQSTFQTSCTFRSARAQWGTAESKVGGNHRQTILIIFLFHNSIFALLYIWTLFSSQYFESSIHRYT